MSAVRRWTLFLRAVLIGIAILLLGLGAFRVHVIEDQRLALWPTFDLLHLDHLEGQAASSLVVPAAVQVAVWTALTYVLFLGLDSIRHGGSRRS